LHQTCNVKKTNYFNIFLYYIDYSNNIDLNKGLTKKEKWNIENTPPTKEEQRVSYKGLKNKKPKGYEFT